MKGNVIIPIVLVAGGAYAAFHYGRKALAAKILNIKLRTVKLQPISAAAVTIEVINPTSTPITFDSVTTDVQVNGSALATLNYQKHTTIPANGSMQINLPIKINPIEGALFIASLLTKSKGSPNTISLMGTINGEGLSIPVAITQNLTLPV